MRIRPIVWAFSLVGLITVANAVPALAVSALLAPSSAPVSRAYKLPYGGGVSFTMCQGHNTGTHTGTGEYAWDFCMPIGTPVIAAREGTVRAIRQDSNVNGWGTAFADKNNYVVVNHGDGTSALYMHLMFNGVRVNVGDHVATGQLLAYSGNTGWSHGPHTHFMVMQGDGTNWYAQSIPVAFADVPGDGVPTEHQGYTSGNAKVDPGLQLPDCNPAKPSSRSGFAPFWVESFKATTVWSGADANASSFGPIGAFQYFQVIAPQSGDRLQVKVMATGGLAYVPASDVGPSGPPPTCREGSSRQPVDHG